jgi:hypothetical protein
MLEHISSFAVGAQKEHTKKYPFFFKSQSHQRILVYKYEPSQPHAGITQFLNEGHIIALSSY